MLQNQTWVFSSLSSKVNLLTPSHGEGKFIAYFRAPKEKRGGQYSEDSNSLTVFNERILCIYLFFS